MYYARIIATITPGTNHTEGFEPPWWNAHLFFSKEWDTKPAGENITTDYTLNLTRQQFEKVCELQNENINKFSLRSTPGNPYEKKCLAQMEEFKSKLKPESEIYIHIYEWDSGYAD